MEDSERGNAREMDTMCYFAESTEALGSLLRALGKKEVPGSGLAKFSGLAASAKEYVRGEMWVPEFSTFANRVVDGAPVFKGHLTSVVPFVTVIATSEE